MLMAWRVFLSHTSDLAHYPDGRSFVAAAKDAVVRAGHAPREMEHFPASNEDPADFCRAEVRESDVYIAIVGFDYGTPVPRQPDLSYTQLEFETATRLRLPRLVFLAEEDALPPPRGIATDLHERQQTFRESLQKQAGLTVRSFRSADELELQVFQALSHLNRTSQQARRRTRRRVARRLAVLACVFSLEVSLVAIGAHVFAAPGWTALGTASTDPLGVATLTPPSTLFSSGAMYWTAPIQASKLRVAFDVLFDQGRGYGAADGMAVVMLDANHYSQPVLGDIGGSVGFGGLVGNSVTLIENHVTRYVCYEGASHFVGVADGEVPPATELGGGRCPLNYLTGGSNDIPDFYGRTAHVDIQVTFGRLPEIRVWLDTRRVLDFHNPLQLPSRVFVGFSAGTGLGNERQLIHNVEIQYTPTSSAMTCGGAVRTHTEGPVCVVPFGLWQSIRYRLHAD
jgi:Domain of unknown function (DUF4062)